MTPEAKYFSYDELIARDKASLDILWLRMERSSNRTGRRINAGL